MNTIYRIIFNTATNKWVVASELAKGRKKSTRLVTAMAIALGTTLSAGGAFAGTTASTTEPTATNCQANESPIDGQCKAQSTSFAMPAVRMASGDIGLLAQGGTPVGTPVVSHNGQFSSGDARSPGFDSLAAGAGSLANEQGSTALGNGSRAMQFNTTAVGILSQATAQGATVIGWAANGAGTNSTALGSNSSTGNNATAAVAIGSESSATAANSVALGSNAIADRANTVSVGSAMTMRQIVNVGNGTQAHDAINVSQLTPVLDALGGGASMDPNTGAILGPTYMMDDGTGNMVAVTNLGDAMTNIDGRVSSNTTQIANNTTQITSLDGRVTENSTQIGNLADQLANSGIGLLSQDAATGVITLGAGVGGASLNIGGTDGNRVLSGLANGVEDSDAVTLAQLKASGLVDPISGDPLSAVAYDDISLGSVTFGGTTGTVLNNVAPGLIAAGSMQAVNGSQLFEMQQNFQSQFDNINDRVGTIEQGIADGTIGGGNGGGGDVPGGAGSGDGSLQVGEGANASGDNGTAVGNGAVASGSGSTATGAGAVASGSGSTAVGAGATASGKDSTALGSNSSATGNNSVALGAGSVADRDNTVSVGSEGNERQITNVAAGTQRTDAANWGQVQDAVNGVKDWANQKFTQMDRRIDRMGAMSAAYGQMAFSAQGLEQKNRLGVGVGMQNGQSAIAVGYSRQLSPKMNLSFGGSASAGDVSVGAGVAVGW